MIYRLLAFLSIILAGCSGCSSTRLNVRDPQAQAVQRVISRSVKVMTAGFYANSPDRPKDSKPIGSFLALGSGFVVSWSPQTNHSLVVSAGHVCHDEDTIDVEYSNGVKWEAPVLGQRWKIMNFKGEQLDAVPVLIDESTDVCYLDVSGWAGEVARFYTNPLPIGAKLVTAGAPHGLYEPGLIPYQEGIFFGYKTIMPGFTVMGTSIPVVQGMSGSGVYYRDRLVGFVDAVRQDFQHVSYLVQARDVLRTLPEAMKTWLGSLKNISRSPR